MDRILCSEDKSPRAPVESEEDGLTSLRGALLMVVSSEARRLDKSSINLFSASLDTLEVSIRLFCCVAIQATV